MAPGSKSLESLIRPSSKRHRTVIEGSTKDARSMKRASMAAVGVRWATFSLAPFAPPPQRARFPLLMDCGTSAPLFFAAWAAFRRCRPRVAANRRGARPPQSLILDLSQASSERHLARAAPFDQRARSARSTSEVGHAEIRVSARPFAVIQRSGDRMRVCCL
jgi:hypothetical protein